MNSHAHAHHADAVSAKSGNKAKDPVCGMMVQIEGASHTAFHQGQNYYFVHRAVRENFKIIQHSI